MRGTRVLLHRRRRSNDSTTVTTVVLLSLSFSLPPLRFAPFHLTLPSSVTIRPRRSSTYATSPPSPLSSSLSLPAPLLHRVAVTSATLQHPSQLLQFLLLTLSFCMQVARTRAVDSVANQMNLCRALCRSPRHLQQPEVRSHPFALFSFAAPHDPRRPPPLFTMYFRAHGALRREKGKIPASSVLFPQPVAGHVPLTDDRHNRQAAPVSHGDIT